MADQYNDLVGTGETYTTIDSWELARGQDSSAWTGDHRGRFKAEDHGIGNTVLNNDDSSATHWLIVTADDGAEHDGRANEVSAAGSARFTNFPKDRIISNADARVEISWMEFHQTKPPGGNSYNIYWSSDGNALLHHNIIHSNRSDTIYGEENYFENDTSSTLFAIYRNIFYGTGTNYAAQISRSYIQFIHNTVGPCTVTAVFSTLVNATNNERIENNASFPGNSQTAYSLDADGTITNNASDDSTGDSGLQNLTATNEFTNYITNNFSALDLTLKDVSATLYQAGTGTYSTSTYPEINIPITDREATISGTWSIGADDIIGAAPTGANLFVNVTWWLR